VLAFWLVPARPERELFAELIRILAAEMKALPFEPHLTICAAPDTSDARQALRKISAAPIRLQIASIGVSNRFTKTLFVRFRPHRALDELNRRMRAAAEVPQHILREPHLSLLYQRMPISAKKELASVIRLPFREVIFDAVKTVRCSSPTRTAVDVNSWRVVATKKLSE
jgi:cyclic phosphodiesterase-like protein